MAKPRYSAPTLPAGVNDPALPEDLRQGMQKAYQNANDEYGNSFTAHHPVASNVISAAIGGLLLGPAGLAYGPIMNNVREKNRKAGISSAYENYIDKALERQKAVDGITAPRNEAGYTNGIIGTEIDAGRINPNTPRLNPHSAYSTDFLKNTLSGTTNPASLNLLDNVINNQQGQSYGLPSQTGFGKPQPQPAAPSLAPVEGVPTYNASAQKIYKPMADGYNPADLPTFMSDATLGNIEQAQTSAANTALGQGQQRLEFDAKAPQRDAELQKSLQEVRNLLLTGRKTEAETKLKQLEAQWYGKKTQSEINRNNRPPAAADHNPTTASELARMYQLGAFGKPGTPQALQAYSSALQNNPEGYTTVTDYTRDDEGHVTGSTSRRVPAGAGSAPSISSGKGQTITLSSGKKVKI